VRWRLGAFRIKNLQIMLVESVYSNADGGFSDLFPVHCFEIKISILLIL
jgi:hypothetical protein